MTFGRIIATFPVLWEGFASKIFTSFFTVLYYTPKTLSTSHLIIYS